MQRFADAADGEFIAGPVADWVRNLEAQPGRREVQLELAVWNSPLVLVLFIALICLDTYVRKRQGLA